MAPRTRLATTRRAKYGTVVSPTKVASSSASDARNTVPQTLPASRETVEKRAAPKASNRPARASRNRTQTRDRLSQGKRAAICGLGWVPGKIWSSPMREPVLYQHMTPNEIEEVTEETFR